MIMSAFANIEMSSSLIDCWLSDGGPDGRRGQGDHECEGTQASACHSPDDGEAVDGGQGGHLAGADDPPHPAPHRAGGTGGRPRARASGTGQALEPADPRHGQGHGADAVREAVWGFWPDVGRGKLAECHGVTLSDETLRRWLRASEIEHFARRKRPHRAWRERKAHEGALIQLDGSHHDWLEGRGPRGVLMAYIDDASSRVWARFYEYEGTLPAMDSFTRYVTRYGIPLAVYADKHTTYKSPALPTDG